MECAPAEREQGARPRPPRPPPPLTTERSSFADIQKLFNKAHHHVQKGLSLDEEGKDSEARDEYKIGMQRIQQAMAIDCENLTLSSDEKDSVKQMQQKMTKTRLQVEYRLQSLEGQTQSHSEVGSMDVECPPSYDEVMSSPASMATDPMTSLGDSIMNDEMQNGTQGHMNANRIFEIADGVQIFFITPEGYVSAPSYPSSLGVFKFREGIADGNQPPPSFMQVNEWVYPLIPGTSPALKTSYGAYMFPDTASDIPGAAVGLMLPENLGTEERHKFEQLLRSLTVMEDQIQTPVEGASAPPEHVTYPQLPREQPANVYPEVPTAPMGEIPTAPVETKEREPQTTSGKISRGIIVAADYLSWGLGKGAEKAGQFIRYGSGKIQERLRPEDNPKPIDPKVQKGAQYARQATHAAVKVSAYVVGKLSDATAALGRQVAPHIRKQGEKYLPQVFKTSKDGQSKFDGVLEVAASGLKGFGTVYMGLETSAKALAKSIANETVQVVHHKYGDDASKFAENTLYSVGNVAMTAYNADNIGVKAIAKRAAKDTGKAVLTDLQDTRAAKREQGGQKPGEVCNGKTPSPSNEPNQKM